jgi:hypothetical protein
VLGRGGRSFALPLGTLAVVVAPETVLLFLKHLSGDEVHHTAGRAGTHIDGADAAIVGTNVTVLTLFTNHGVAP